VQFTWLTCLPAGRWWVDVFIIQLFVPITMILINLVVSMNLWRSAPHPDLSGAGSLGRKQRDRSMINK
jgi:hypothetical protein